MYDAEISSLEETYDADSDYGINVLINRQNRSNSVTSSFWRQWKHEISYILVINWSMKLKFGI